MNWKWRVEQAAQLLGEIGPRAKIAARWLPGKEGVLEENVPILLARWRLTRSPEVAEELLERVWHRNLDRTTSSYDPRPVADALLEVMPAIRERFSKLGEPDDDARKQILARIAWKEGRIEEALRLWRKVIFDRRLDATNRFHDFEADLAEAGSLAKPLFADLAGAMEFHPEDRDTCTRRCLLSIDPDGYRELLEKFAAEGP